MQIMLISSVLQGIFVLYAICYSKVSAQPYNIECSFGSQALTEAFNIDIPQTCFTLRGYRRCFYTFLPECATHSQEKLSLPLVLDLHDYNDCPVRRAQTSGWMKKAIEECFVLVWPTGNNLASMTDTTCWHVPGGNHLSPEPNQTELGDGTRPCCCQREFQSLESSTHDADFLRLVAKFAATQVPERTDQHVTIDSTRVYFTGHGNGCTMALTMAALQSDFVSAVCCTAGTFLTPPSPDYSPTPVWNLLGEEDIMVPYEGFYDPNYGLIYPDAQASFKKLAILNGCGEFIRHEEDIPLMDIDDEEGKMIQDIASSCVMNATVEFVTLTTAGHTLQLSYDTQREMYPTYASRTTVDTAALAWEFCKVHTLSSTSSVAESESLEFDSLRMESSLPPAWSPITAESTVSSRSYRFVWISAGLTLLSMLLTLDII